MSHAGAGERVYEGAQRRLKMMDILLIVSLMYIYVCIYMSELIKMYTSDMCSLFFMSLIYSSVKVNKKVK